MTAVSRLESDTCAILKKLVLSPAFAKSLKAFAKLRNHKMASSALETSDHDTPSYLEAKEAIEVIVLPRSAHEVVVIGTSWRSANAADLVSEVMEDEQPDGAVIEVDWGYALRLLGERAFFEAALTRPNLGKQRRLHFDPEQLGIASPDGQNEPLDVGKQKKSTEGVTGDSLASRQARSGIYPTSYSGTLACGSLAIRHLWAAGLANLQEKRDSDGETKAALEEGLPLGVPVVLAARDRQLSQLRAGAEIGFTTAIRRALLDAMGVAAPLDYTPTWSSLGSLYWLTFREDWTSLAACMAEISDDARNTPSARRMQAKYHVLQEISRANDLLIRKAVARGTLSPFEASTFIDNAKKVVNLSSYLSSNELIALGATRALTEEKDVCLAYSAWELCKQLEEKDSKELGPLDGTGPKRIVAIMDAARVEGFIRNIKAFDDSSKTKERDLAPILEEPALSFFQTSTAVEGLSLASLVLPFVRRLPRVFRFGPLVATTACWSAAYAAYLYPISSAPVSRVACALERTDDLLRLLEGMDP
jgi:pheromone shutdown protein TraB